MILIRKVWNKNLLHFFITIYNSMLKDSIVIYCFLSPSKGGWVLRVFLENHSGPITFVKTPR